MEVGIVEEAAEDALHMEADDDAIDELLASAHDENQNQQAEQGKRLLMSRRYVVPPIPMSRSFFKVAKNCKGARVIFGGEMMKP